MRRSSCRCWSGSPPAPWERRGCWGGAPNTWTETGVPLEQASKGNWNLTSINWEELKLGNIRCRLLIFWERSRVTVPPPLLRPTHPRSPAAPLPAQVLTRGNGKKPLADSLVEVETRGERPHYVTSSYITDAAATKIAAPLCNWERGGEEQHCTGWETGGEARTRFSFHPDHFPARFTAVDVPTSLKPPLNLSPTKAFCYFTLLGFFFFWVYVALNFFFFFNNLLSRYVVVLCKFELGIFFLFFIMNLKFWG